MFHGRSVCHRPLVERREGLAKRLGHRRDGVLDAHRGCRQNMPSNESVSLETLERIREGLVRYAVETTHDLVEA